MDNEECIKILNTLLKKMDVKGFYFGLSRYNELAISLYIPCEIDDGLDFQHCTFKSVYHMFNGIDGNAQIKYLLTKIEKAKIRGTNGLVGKNNPANILGINDSGIEFLKLLDRCMGCSSLLEFKMKLQVMGYEI